MGATRELVRSAAIDVLDQIVAADAEEAGLARQLVGDGHRRGHFDHDADADVLPERQPFPFQFGLRFANQGFRLAQLVERSDHRQQQLDWRAPRRPGGWRGFACGTGRGGSTSREYLASRGMGWLPRRSPRRAHSCRRRYRARGRSVDALPATRRWRDRRPVAPLRRARPRGRGTETPCAAHPHPRRHRPRLPRLRRYR